MKLCFKCDKSKPLTEFYNHPRTKDGKLGKCKDCTKGDSKTHYSENRESYARYEKKRGEDAERKAYMVERQRDSRQANPLKYKARNKVNNAIRGGKLIKEACSCGSLEVEAHHADYTKPLDVEWLCRGCHLRKHGKEKF